MLKKINTKYLFFYTLIFAILFNVNNITAQEVLEGVVVSPVQTEKLKSQNNVTLTVTPSQITKKAGTNDYEFSIEIYGVWQNKIGRYCIRKDDLTYDKTHIYHKLNNVLIFGKTNKSNDKLWFTLKEGFPGGNFIIKIKFTYAKDGTSAVNGDVKQFSGNKEFTIIYKNVPQIKNQAEIDRDAKQEKIDKEAQQKLYAEVETEHKNLFKEIEDDKNFPDLKIYGKKIHNESTSIKDIKSINKKLNKDITKTKELQVKYTKLFEDLSENKPNYYDAMRVNAEFLKKRLVTIKSLKTEIAHKLVPENTALEEKYTPIFSAQKIEIIEIRLTEWDKNRTLLTKETAKEFKDIKNKYEDIIKNFTKNNENYTNDKAGLSDFPEIDTLIANIKINQEKIDSALIPDLNNAFIAKGFDVRNKKNVKIPIPIIGLILSVIIVGIFIFIKLKKNN